MEESYDRDKEPEDRTEYSGGEGMSQRQKDQVYLMNKELRDKCKKASLDLLIAQDNNDTEAAEKAEGVIKDTCK